MLNAIFPFISLRSILVSHKRKQQHFSGNLLQEMKGFCKSEFKVQYIFWTLEGATSKLFELISTEFLNSCGSKESMFILRSDQFYILKQKQIFICLKKIMICIFIFITKFLTYSLVTHSYSNVNILYVYRCRLHDLTLLLSLISLHLEKPTFF